MLSVSMYITTFLFSLLSMYFYPDWHWIAENPTELLVQAALVIMMFISAAVNKLEHMVIRLKAMEKKI